MGSKTQTRWVEMDIRRRNEYEHRVRVNGSIASQDVDPVHKKRPTKQKRGIESASAFGSWNVRQKCPANMFGGNFHVRRDYPSPSFFPSSMRAPMGSPSTRETVTMPGRRREPRPIFNAGEEGEGMGGGNNKRLTCFHA